MQRRCNAFAYKLENFSLKPDNMFAKAQKQLWLYAQECFVKEYDFTYHY